MAYASTLPDNLFSKYYDELEKRVSSESQSMFAANGRKPGQYKGDWSYLFDDWLSDKATNVYVQDCLLAGRVIDGYLF